MSDLRRGSQRPTLLHEPPDAVDWELSDIAVDARRRGAMSSTTGSGGSFAGRSLDVPTSCGRPVMSALR